LKNKIKYFQETILKYKIKSKIKILGYFQNSILPITDGSLKYTTQREP